MREPTNLRDHRVLGLQARVARAERIADAIETAMEICQRARAQGTGMVVYPVSDIELILEALTGKRP